MLFNSHLYIFLFLPIAVAGFFVLARLGGEIAAITWLVLLSIVFYGWWDPMFVPLLLGSVAVNYFFGSYLQTAADRRMAGYVLAIGVICNLILLGYFKYAGFFADIAGNLIGADFHIGKIMLPLGVSFFTFQQIAYLVDSHKQDTAPGGFMRYCLFVTFFPKVITGPIVRHKEIMPQLLDSSIYRLVPLNMAVGFGIFTIGLFKKVIIADGLVWVVAPAFSQAAAGQDPGFYISWLAAFAYALQVYFDFSGYTDMAIGAALMFGIHLPANFYSPYKADSITEMWRRWHMTLTRLITEFIFSPLSLRLARLSLNLSSNRWLMVILANVLPLIAAFLIVGLWHGAGWTFVLFGLFHGVLLSIHVLWQELKRTTGLKLKTPRVLGVFLTLLVWVWGVVMFRAPNLATASKMYESMLNFPAVLQGFDASVILCVGVILIYLLVLTLPNTEQMFHSYRPKLADKNLERSRTSPTWLTWRENGAWAMFLGILFFVGIVLMQSKVEFIYFQF
jgi:alginate O-acetyltransferase complex protein AlgI